MPSRLIFVPAGGVYCTGTEYTLLVNALVAVYSTFLNPIHPDLSDIVLESPTPSTRSHCHCRFLNTRPNPRHHGHQWRPPLETLAPSRLHCRRRENTRWQLSGIAVLAHGSSTRFSRHQMYAIA